MSKTFKFSIIFTGILGLIIINELFVLWYIKNKLPQSVCSDAYNVSQMLYGKIQNNIANKSDKLPIRDLQSFFNSIVKNNSSKYIYTQKTTGYVVGLKKYDKDQYVLVDIGEAPGAKSFLTIPLEIGSPLISNTIGGLKKMVTVEKLSLGMKVTYKFEMDLATQKTTYEIIQE